MRLIEHLIDSGWTVTLWTSPGDHLHRQRLQRGDMEIIETFTYIDDDVSDQLRELEFEYSRIYRSHEKS